MSKRDWKILFADILESIGKIEQYTQGKFRQAPFLTTKPLIFILAKKQDCEIAAAKRWLRVYGPSLKQLGFEAGFSSFAQVFPVGSMFFQF